MIDFKTLNVGADGLVPAIVQDRNTLQVLMLGYMNARLWKRPRQAAW